jgi:hypothetical protein
MGKNPQFLAATARWYETVHWHISDLAIDKSLPLLFFQMVPLNKLARGVPNGAHRIARIR